MCNLVKVEKIGTARTFQNGNGENVVALDLELSQGAERYLATAFDKQVTAIQALNLVAGAFVWIELHFMVNGSERRFQTVRIQNIALM